MAKLTVDLELEIIASYSPSDPEVGFQGCWEDYEIEDASIEGLSIFGGLSKEMRLGFEAAILNRLDYASMDEVLDEEAAE